LESSRAYFLLNYFIHIQLKLKGIVLFHLYYFSFFVNQKALAVVKYAGFGVKGHASVM
jgi:hypothetical protein